MEGASVVVRLVDGQLLDGFSSQIGPLNRAYLPQGRAAAKYAIDPAKLGKDKKTVRKLLLPKGKDGKAWIKESNQSVATLTGISHYQF